MAVHFEVPPEVWKKMSEAERWAANQKFLDRAIERGTKFILSTKFNLKSIKKGTFERELEYLISKGYTPSKDGYTLSRRLK